MEDVTTIAKGISDWGMMAITAAFFLVLSAGLMIACFKWFKSIINGIINSTAKTMNDLLNETRVQNEMLADISEGLRPETQLRIKNTSSTYFDLSVEKVCRLIKKIREENHIVDRKATVDKIRNLVRTYMRIEIAVLIAILTEVKNYHLILILIGWNGLQRLLRKRFIMKMVLTMEEPILIYRLYMKI